MDAVKYLKEVYRMCKSIEGCSDCPLRGCSLTFPCKGNTGSAEYKETEKCVSIVEKWSAEHKKETRQSEFLKMFPDAPVVNGHIDICPKYTDDKILGYDYCYKLCEDCKKEYWLTEVE